MCAHSREEPGRHHLTLVRKEQGAAMQLAPGPHWSPWLTWRDIIKDTAVF